MSSDTGKSGGPKKPRRRTEPTREFLVSNARQVTEHLADGPDDPVDFEDHDETDATPPPGLARKTR